MYKKKDYIHPDYSGLNYIKKLSLSLSINFLIVAKNLKFFILY